MKFQTTSRPDHTWPDALTRIWENSWPGSARVPNLRVCEHPPFQGWHTQGVKGESTSCRGTVWSAWQKPPVNRTRRMYRAARKGKWSPRGTVMTVLTYPGVRPGEQARLVKTVNIQVRCAAAHPGQDRRLPGEATHSRLQQATSA